MKNTRKEYEITYYSVIKGQFVKVILQKDEVDEYKKEWNQLSEKMQKKFGNSVFDFIHVIYSYNG